MPLTLQLRRTSPWDPPTPLDHLLTSPIQGLTSFFYHRILLPLQGTPAGVRYYHYYYPSVVHNRVSSPKPDHGGDKIRIVCLSDTHTNTLKEGGIPEGDVLIHAGDLTNEGTPEEINAQLDWLRGLPHQWKVVVGGNHDSGFDPGTGVCRTEELNLGDEGGLIYLCEGGVELKVKGGKRVVRVWGWGAVPRCGEGFAYQYERDNPPWENSIPEGIDILVTHTPPATHLDLSLGCPSLLRELWRVRPRLHVFGHVHAAHGTEVVWYDACQREYERLMLRPAKGLLWDLIPSMKWVESLSVVWYGVLSIVRRWFGGSRQGGLLVNAAVMYRDSGVLGNPVTVVELD